MSAGIAPAANNVHFDYKQHLLWYQNICKLAICDDASAIHFTSAVWLVQQHAGMLVQFYQLTCVKTLFSTRPQGVCKKFGALGTSGWMSRDPCLSWISGIFGFPQNIKENFRSCFQEFPEAVPRDPLAAAWLWSQNFDYTNFK